jgi:hypothetical protein
MVTGVGIIGKQFYAAMTYFYYEKHVKSDSFR